MTRVQVNLVPHFQHVSASDIGHFAQAVKSQLVAKLLWDPCKILHQSDCGKLPNRAQSGLLVQLTVVNLGHFRC